MSSMTAEERALIDRAVQAGQVTRVPTGQSGLPDTGLAWCPIRNRLLYSEPPEPKRVGAPVPAAVVERRARVRRMAEDGKVPSEIAQMFGVSVHVIYADLTKLGIKARRKPGSGKRSAP